MARRPGAAAAAALAALLLAAGWLLWRGTAKAPAPSTPAGTVTALLSEDVPGGFALATAPRAFRFPDDHGPHPEYRHEWWYFTGNLKDPGGRRFGYQLTFFRFALSPPGAPPRGSRWDADQAYMAHFSVTDVEGNAFRHSRAARPRGLGDGGGGRPAVPGLDRRMVRRRGNGLPDADPAARFRGRGLGGPRPPVGRPPVPQGEGGLSRKGAAPGNASYYYSITRLSTRGAVRIGGTSWNVEGNSWLDREWGTSALGVEHSGWDWFALHLSDGRDLMYYRLRRRDGGVGAFSSGMLAEPDGSFRALDAREAAVEVLGHWRSPSGGVRYPARWRLRVPSEGIELSVVPRVADQELRTLVRYWEGAVSAEGVSRGRPVEGEGYVELTGYGEAAGR
jgi:predicted secreted hydrolase